MAYRYGDRLQMTLLPKCIDDYVSQDAPVRAYDAFVDVLNFEELGIELDCSKVGNSQYDPKAMLKLLVYGYSYGIKSSRKLERATHDILSFIWLVGGLNPDHKTIAEYRRNNKESLRKVLKQCARLCIELDLISGNVLFVDGTKIRANAGRGRTHDKEWYEKQLKGIDERIEELLAECEAADEKERELDGFVSMEKELSKAGRLKERVKEALKEIKGKELVNQTDPDCAIMRSAQGGHASYNIQSVVDDKNGLIVHADATSETSDIHQFSRQIEEANGILREPCEVACADAGYADTKELEKIDSQGIKVVVPYRRPGSSKADKPFSKKAFRYDKERNSYFCPEGHELVSDGSNKKKGKRYYIIKDRSHCHSCQHYGECTSAIRGRKVTRLFNEEVKEKLEAQYAEPSSQAIYKRRKNRVELPFGHIKKNLKTDGFLLRRLRGVRAETSLLATCFNISRMITILGIRGLIRQLAAVEM